ncbi:MAG: hypothetical protein ACOVQX_04900 [Legionella sp.]
MSIEHKNYLVDEKANIALEALKGDMTQAEISSKFVVLAFLKIIQQKNV